MTPPHTSRSARPAGRRLRRVIALLAAAMAAITLVPVAAGPAAADDFGLDTEYRRFDGPGSIPEDLTHDYCFDFDINTPEGAIVGYFLWQGYFNVMNATAYNEAYSARCTDDTDVVFRIDNGLSATGQATCRSWVAYGFACRSNLVRVNMSKIRDQHHLIKIGCHEVGHTIGLADGPLSDPNGWWNDCMTDSRDPGGAQFETINQHHIDHANSRFPFDDAGDDGWNPPLG